MTDSSKAGGDGDLLVQFTRPNLDSIKAESRAWLKLEIWKIDPENPDNARSVERERRAEAFALLKETLGEFRFGQLYSRTKPVQHDPTVPEYHAICAIIGAPMSSAGGRTTPTIESFDQPQASIIQAAAYAHPKERRKMLERYRKAVPEIIGRTTTLVIVGAIAVSSFGAGWLIEQRGQSEREQLAELQEEHWTLRAELNGVRNQTAAALIRSGEEALYAGQFFAARQSFENAHDHAEHWLAQEPGSPDAIFHSAQPEFWLGELARFDGDNNEARDRWLDYASFAAELAAVEPGSARSLAEVAYGNLNLSIMDFEAGEFELARTGFEAAYAGLNAARMVDADTVNANQVANAVGWLADSQLALGLFADAAASRRTELGTYNEDAEAWRVLNAEYRQVQAMISLGQTDQAERIADRAISEAVAYLDENPTDTLVRQRVIDLLGFRAEVAAADGRFIQSKLLADRAEAVEIIGRRGEDRAPRASDAARVAILAAEVALASGAYDDALRRSGEAISSLSEVDSPMGGHAVRIARARLTAGLARALQGDLVAADRDWRLGLAALRSGPGHILEDVYRARLLHLTGDQRGAEDVRRQLAELGYSDPSDAVFWARFADPLTAQSFMHGEDEDG